MNATPFSIFRHYLNALLQQGVLRTPLTDEARLVLRAWYIAAKQGKTHTSDTKPPTKPTQPKQILSTTIKLPEGSKEERLRYLRELAQNWSPARNLHTLRDTMVFASGSPHAELMLIGEAPGYYEELQQEPFVGRAGEKLNQILKAMGLSRDLVYISNIVKFRPAIPNQKTNNRAPSREEIDACLPIIMNEIQVIQPKMILALGGTAAEGLLGLQASVSSLRGRFHDLHGIPVRITYHPSYLLRSDSPKEKRKVWEDMLSIMERLNIPISEKQRTFFLPKKEFFNH